MNVGLAFNPAAFAMTAANAATKAQAAAQTGAVGAHVSRDRVSKNAGRRKAMNKLLGKVSQAKIQKAAAKVGKKKGV